MSESDKSYNYNFIFSQIVESDDDFVGSMAYVLYKKNKIEYIEQYKKGKGREPNFGELREWQKSECTKLKLDNYKKLATQKTNEFINILQGEKEKQLNKLKTDLNNKEREIKEREKRLNDKEKELQKRNSYCHVKTSSSIGGFISGVAQSFVASLIFVILGYIFIIYLNRETDVLKVLNKNDIEQLSVDTQDSIIVDNYKANK